MYQKYMIKVKLNCSKFLPQAAAQLLLKEVWHNISDAQNCFIMKETWKLCLCIVEKTKKVIKTKHIQNSHDWGRLRHNYKQLQTWKSRITQVIWSWTLNIYVTNSCFWRKRRKSTVILQIIIPNEYKRTSPFNIQSVARIRKLFHNSCILSDLIRTLHSK